jgi:CO/xanthine dehydrogenase Mo-binding subunit
MLIGKALRSPFPHARIINIDASRALKVPGVHTVITAQDLPDRRVGRLLRDIPVLARDRVLFVGEKVAAVAAEDAEAADEALALIDAEYEELPAVYGTLEAMQVNAPVLHPGLASYQGLPQPASDINNVFAHNSWSKGDLEQGFKEADLIFENTFTAQLMHQAYIEPHACVVDVAESGRVEGWVNNKGPFNLRQQVSAVWDVPQDQITFHPLSIGGDFGGKGSFMDVPLCYYLALYSGRPVKMVMNYIEELMAGNPRHPATITLKTGVKNDGKLWAHEARLVFNSGAYGAFKPRVTLGGADRSGGPYVIPNVAIDSYMVYTNNVPCGHMRAPAKPQTIFAVESHMDMIARDMGIDPVEFRLRNVLHDGDLSPTGASWRDIRAEDTLKEAARAAGWGTPREKINTGLGIAIGDQPPGAGQSTAKLTMDEMAKVTLHMSLWDTGTGAHTILRQVVAEELTIPVLDVGIVAEDTNAVDFESGPGGSRVTYTAGQTVLGAVTDLRNRLMAFAAELYDCPVEQIRLQEGRMIVSDQPGRENREIPLTELAARAVDSTDGEITGEYTFTAPASDVTGFSAQVAEVEVDPETGQIKVNKIVSAHDVGMVLNPLTHQGQVEGGVIQGLGYALMEEMTTENGRISSLSFGDYKIPTIQDIPILETVLVESNSGPAPYESKGIGESSNVPVAGAIANAVHDAIGVRITSLPITAEKVLEALRLKSSH